MVDGSGWTGSQLGLDSISANVEFLTVFWVRISWMRKRTVVGSQNFLVGARKAISQFLFLSVFLFASFSLCRFWPSASSLVVVVDESTGTSDWVGNALYTIVKAITHLRIFVRKVTVLARTLNCRHSGL